MSQTCLLPMPKTMQHSCYSCLYTNQHNLTLTLSHCARREHKYNTKNINSLHSQENTQVETSCCKK